ncbi:hypothetical protein ASG85_10225 [Paenibacillus sp. Soil724D2]|nr:hypothetical protein ASG85_10225 [Paenibacillus sp. Soil724D2]
MLQIEMLITLMVKQLTFLRILNLLLRLSAFENMELPLIYRGMTKRKESHSLYRQAVIRLDAAAKEVSTEVLLCQRALLKSRFKCGNISFEVS